jgi:hypothetical protein
MTTTDDGVAPLERRVRPGARRLKYDTARAAEVLRFLQTPRTRAELLSHYGGDRAGLFAAWNLCKRGLAESVIGDDGRARYAALSTRRAAFSAEAGRDLQALWNRA